MRIALDTYILAYAEGTNGLVMRDKALDLIQRLSTADVVLPVRTLGELFNVLVRKARRRADRARTAVLSWRDAYAVVETSATVTGQRSRSGVRPWPYNLGLRCADRLSGGRMLVASIGRPIRGIYVAWTHGDQSVCTHTSSRPGSIAHDARRVNPGMGPGWRVVQEQFGNDQEVDKRQATREIWSARHAIAGPDVIWGKRGCKKDCVNGHRRKENRRSDGNRCCTDRQTACRVQEA